MNSIKEKTLFCEVGFNAENAIKELTRLKEGKTPNLYSLSSNQEILENYSNMLDKNPNLGNYAPLLIKEFYEARKGKDGQALLRELISNAKKTKSVLETIAENENVALKDIDKGIQFFQGLSKRCKTYSED